MKKNTYLLMFMMFALVLLGGCRTAPIMNIDAQPIVASGNYTLTDVKNAIIRAGVKLGWQMQAKEPGRIIATLYLREHMAKVGIMFDKKKYSIKYMDSSNLEYDGTNIHSNYNGWIQHLNHTIGAQLSGL